MISILFSIMMLIVFGKLFVWSIRAAWGVTKILVTIVFLPMILIGLACAGTIYLAIILLGIIGLVTFIGSVV